jgi:hypothetical protein
MRSLLRLTLFACAFAALHAATLEKLTLDDMIAKSSDIVRGKIVASNASFRGQSGRGGMIYTHYTVKVTDRWKGAAASTMDVAVPGGMVGGYRQTFAGAPNLNVNDEFVFFLWTSRSGLTQVIGLTQGIFNLTLDGSGKQVLSRSASTEVMLDPASGAAVQDTAVSLPMSEFKTRVTSVLNTAAAQSGKAGK